MKAKHLFAVPLALAASMAAAPAAQAQSQQMPILGDSNVQVEIKRGIVGTMDVSVADGTAAVQIDIFATSPALGDRGRVRITSEVDARTG